MLSKTGFAFRLVFGLCAGELCFAGTLPPPIDVPAPPPRAAPAPGGKALPALGGTPATGAPELSVATDPVLPDETLSAAGSDLDNATLLVWAEGVTRQVVSLRAKDNRLQAILPKDLPATAMLVWPQRGGFTGRPYRLNAAEAWWLWPCRAQSGRPGETVRVFGKNLSLAGFTPLLHIEGRNYARTLPVKTAEPYHLEAALPPDIVPGTYKAWAHNGTGGRYGWSEALSFEVTAGRDETKRQVFRAEDFGAQGSDNRDDTEALEIALKKAGQSGGVLRFGAGTFHVSRALKPPAGVSIEGVGMGKYDGSNIVSGTATVLRPLPGSSFPEALFVLEEAGVTLRNLALFNGNNGKRQSTLLIRSADCRVEGVCIVQTDERDWSEDFRGTQSIIDTPALHLLGGQPANVVIRKCEVHAPIGLVQIGENANAIPSHNDDKACPPSTDWVLIQDTIFRGYHAGSPNGVSQALYENALSAGVAIYNGKRVIVERCDFGGADRCHARVLNRTITCVNTSIKDCYFAHNRSMNVGNHPSLFEKGGLKKIPSARNSAKNQGESYIFHYHYPQGGLFNVVSSQGDTTAVTTTGINPKFPTPAGYRASWNSDGSRIINEVGENDHWILYIASGKGAGQYREIKRKTVSGEQVSFTLTKPWRVAPDATSRVVLTVAYRHNIMYHNFLDSGVFVPEIKIHLVCFWYNAFDNIIAANTARNVTSGVVYNSSYRNPTGWNLTVDNVIEHVHGQAYDTSEFPGAYVDHYRAYGGTFPKEQGDVLWYIAGNAARRNVFRDAEVGAFLHTRNVATVTGLASVSHRNGGLLLCVLEHNRFENCRDPVRLGAPANWALIRDNTFTGTADERTAVVAEAGDSIIEPLIRQGGRTIPVGAPPTGPLLRNGGFEEIDTSGVAPFYWRFFHAQDSLATVSLAGEAGEGKQCIRIEKSNNTNYSGAAYDGPAVRLDDKKTYRFTGQVKGTAGKRFSAVVMMMDGNHKFLGHHTVNGVLTGQWKSFVSDFQPKPGAVSLRLELRAQGDAYTVYYDQVSLEEKK